MAKTLGPTSTGRRRLWPFGVAVVALVVGAVMLASDSGWADRTGWVLLGVSNVITLVTSIFNISRFDADGP